MSDFDYSDSQMESLFKGIYEKVITALNLPKSLYKATYKKLIGGVDEGYGAISFGDPDYDLIKELRNNIYMFSGAKTFQQVRHINSLMYEDNKLLSFVDFRKRALTVYSDYNKAYLDSEYVTAITSGTEARQYRKAYRDKKIFPRLKYTAIIDRHTSEVCKRLNGIILPTDSGFWKTNVPPMHFNCRCHIEKIDKYDDEPSSSHGDVTAARDFSDKHTNPLFKMNPAIDKVVFSDKHPYFQIAPRYKKWALKNFGLPIPD